MRLTPESLYLEGRDAFFQGRALLFDKQYAQAADLLEQSVRIDPGEAYGYNALGIAYLEQADFAKAIPAFRDAAKRAPNWSYPLHNLALAYHGSGRLSGDAIRTLSAGDEDHAAVQLSAVQPRAGLSAPEPSARTPSERIGRRSTLAPDSAEPLNALGSLKAAEGKTAEAEKLYREALAEKCESACRAA